MKEFRRCRWTVGKHGWRRVYQKEGTGLQQIGRLDVDNCGDDR